MSRLDLLIALRAAIRDVRYTLVNLIGLSAAFAGAMLIGLYVLHEHNYERWLPNVEKTALVYSELAVQDQENYTSSRTQFALAPEIEGRIPGVERVARVRDQSADTVLQSHVENQVYLAVDPVFLEMIPFPAVEGDPALAIAQPHTLVVTQRYAEKWFGARHGVLGRTVRLRLQGELVPFTVGAVIEDPVGPSHFNLQALFNLDRRDSDIDFDNWGGLGCRTYVQLAPGANQPAILQTLNETFQAGIRRQLGEESDPGFAVTYGVVPLESLRFRKPELLDNGDSTSPMFVLGLAGACLVILTLMLANFAALSSAMAARRARETAIRRTLGAAKGAVGAQFLTESVVFAAAAIALGLALTAVVLPAFNALVGLELNLAPLASASGVTTLAGLAIVTGLLGGSAPALMVVRMDPARVLAGGGAGARGSAAGVRFVVVAAQYAISAALICGALVSYAQVQHMAKATINFVPEGMVLIKDAVRPEATRLDALLETLRATPGVAAVGVGSNGPGIGSVNTDRVLKGSGEGVYLQRMSVEAGYLSAYKTPLLAGRWFDPTRPEDDALLPDGSDWSISQNVVLNETGARAMGFRTPSTALDQTFRRGDRLQRVIGVVADQAFTTLRAPPDGAYYLLDRRDLRAIAVRFSGVDQETAVIRTENAWRSVYPDLPVEVEPVDNVLWELYAKERRQTYALIGFSGLAVLLAALGAFALSASSAERRGREMAIRRIVGADGWSIAALHLRRALVPAAIGAGLATPLAIAGAERWPAFFENRIDGAAAYGLVAGLAVLALAVIAASAEAAALARTPPGKTLQAV